MRLVGLISTCTARRGRNLPEPAAGTVVNMKKIILFTVVGMLFAGFVILLMLRKKPRH